ncbi:AcrR family transcriptional regulator [Sinorhizobium fredii]|uniref:TetR/AcrR family transcriptional regulator n=1 Tax=Rhizobium fredii TaxID=380 RepID=UPI003519CF22
MPDNKTKNSFSELFVHLLQMRTSLSSTLRPVYKVSMTQSKPMSLREKNRLRSRQELLDSVLTLFDEGDLAACSVEAVAKLVGASKTTVYSYFPGGIDEMLRDVYRLISQRVIALGTQLRDAETETGARILAPARALFSICAEPKVGRFYMLLTPCAQSAPPTCGRGRLRHVQGNVRGRPRGIRPRQAKRVSLCRRYQRRHSRMCRIRCQMPRATP